MANVIDYNIAGPSLLLFNGKELKSPVAYINRTSNKFKLMALRKKKP